MEVKRVSVDLCIDGDGYTVSLNPDRAGRILLGTEMCGSWKIKEGNKFKGGSWKDSGHQPRPWPGPGKRDLRGDFGFEIEPNSTVDCGGAQGALANPGDALCWWDEDQQEWVCIDDGFM